MCVLTGKALFRSPFQWREFIQQCWFIMRVAILPTIAVSTPTTALFIFTFKVLLIQVGAPTFPAQAPGSLSSLRSAAQHGAGNRLCGGQLPHQRRATRPRRPGHDR
jgi:ABC-type transporter Mla maintaining outer membrane lipid asymmetry permease subunit MlaE